MQPDTIIPDLSNPQSWNRYSYVTNRPVNFNDPSGHCPGAKPGQKCASNPKAGPLPDWWLNRSHIYIEGYGYFDTGHIRRGWEDTKWFDQEINATLDRGGGKFQNPALSNGSDYKVYYSVSAEMKNATKDQKIGVLYGMYTDFERGYEEEQASRWNLTRFSAFTPEDLPSDHLGSWAYINGLKENDIPSLLKGLGKVSVLPGNSIVVDTYTKNGHTSMSGLIKNYEFLPMVTERIDYGGGDFATQTKNISWPAWLQIVPIPSGPDTWQRETK